jgi:2-haloalkanoic acid dehalogenase type II
VWDEHFFALIRGESFMTFRKTHSLSLTTTFENLKIDSEPDGYVEQIFELLGQVTLYYDVAGALSALEGFPHGVVSNSDSDHLHSALSRNRLSFDLVVSSEDAEAYKPNPEIFEKALVALDLEPGDVLYVGDSQEDDLVATHRGGIRMAWLNREGEALKDGIPKPEFEITSLGVVAEIIKAEATTNEHR